MSPERPAIRRGLKPARLRAGAILPLPPWLRRLGRHPAVLPGIAAFVLALMLVVGLHSLRTGSGPSPTDGALRGSLSGQGDSERPPVAGDPLMLEPPYDSLDGLTILQGAYQVRIAGLEGPSRNAVCTASDGRPWACGLQARAALHNLIADKPLACRTFPTPGLPAGTLAADCSAEGEDLAAALVSAGWARPQAPQGGRFAAERDLARQGRRGLWDGDWAIRGGF